MGQGSGWGLPSSWRPAWALPPTSQLEKAVKAAAGPAQSYIEGTGGLGGKVKASRQTL